MENPGARARKATWNQPLRGGLWILGAPTASGTALRPKCNFTLDLPGLLPPVWTSMVPKGRRPRVGPNQTTRWAKIRQGPNPICFIVYEKTKIWEGPERGGQGSTVQAVYPPESSSAGSLHACQPDKRRSVFVASPRAAPTGGGPTHPPHRVGFYAFRLLRPKQVWVCNNLDAEPL